jgi:hypothetical protein
LKLGVSAAFRELAMVHVLPRIRSIPFTALGLVTYALFLLAEYGNVAMLGAFLRLLIIPMYAGWMLAHLIVQSADRSAALWMPFMYICGFLPYLLADGILHAVRTRRRNRRVATEGV